MNDLDLYLVKLCYMILDNMKNEKYPGLVAACVVGPKGIVARTSSKDGNKWTHAERNAIEAYESEHGPVDEDSIVITTLSPCNEHHDATARERHGESCAEYINSKGIKRVYCGFLDPTQDDHRSEFNQIITSNSQLKTICKDIADLFLNIKK